MNIYVWSLNEEEYSSLTGLYIAHFTTENGANIVILCYELFSLLFSLGDKMVACHIITESITENIYSKNVIIRSMDAQEKK